MYEAFKLVFFSSSHLKSLNQEWDFISDGPFAHSLLLGFLIINLLMKSAASTVHPEGISIK